MRKCKFFKNESREFPWLFPYSWEQRRLGDITESFSGGTPAVGIKEYYGGDIPFIRSAEINSASTELFITKKGLSNSSAKVIEKGCILYALYGATSGEVGVSQLKGAINQAILAIIPQPSYDTIFLMQWLRKSKNEIITTFLQGGQGNLSGAIVKNLMPSIPLHAEQSKIGAFFQLLDRLITLHQRKHFYVFPKSGAFHNEKTNAWEQRKLGKVAPIIMGQSPDGSTYSDSPSTYILVQGNADLKDGWVVPRIWTTQVTKQAVAGDLIMSVRAPAGAMGKTAYNVVLGRGVAAIKGSEFIYQILVKMDSDGYWKKLSCGSTFESLNSDNIFAAEVSLPSSAEQQKIGQFFQSLDRLITLHQRKPLFLFLEELRC